MRNEGTGRSGSGWASTQTGRITPADVQQKQFRTARLGGGYRMREVDEFLDQVTDALSSLIAENEQLRREHAGGTAEPSGSFPAPLATAADLGAIEAFLRREKGFLQSLGSLVQDHAEDLKGMVRAARNSAPADVAGVAPAPGSMPAPAEPDGPATPEAPAATATTWAEEASSAVPLATPDEASLAEGDDGTEDADIAGLEEANGSTETPEAEDPIRLEEPEPARSKRTEGGSEASLRELFWGEE
jgi:DivIVA domain-containing protein